MHADCKNISFEHFTLINEQWKVVIIFFLFVEFSFEKEYCCRSNSLCPWCWTSHCPPCVCVCLHLNVVYSSNCRCKEVRVSRLQSPAPWHSLHQFCISCLFWPPLTLFGSIGILLWRILCFLRLCIQGRIILRC